MFRQSPKRRISMSAMRAVKLGVVHVNVDRRVQRRRRRAGIEANAGDLRGGTLSRRQRMRAGVHIGNRQDFGDLSGKTPVAEQHEDFVSDLGIDQTRIGNVPVHVDVGRIEDFSDRRARHQRLAGMRKTCRDDAADRRNDAAVSEIALHVLEAAAKLFVEFAQVGQLNGRLGDLRLLRGNRLAAPRRARDGFRCERSGWPADDASRRFGRLLGQALIRSAPLRGIPSPREP